MDSESTLRDFLVQHRSTLIWVVSIAVAALVFYISRRKLTADKVADFPNVDLRQVFGWDLILTHGGGGPDLRAGLVEILKKIIKSRWAVLVLIAAAIALVGGCVVKLALDAGTKKFIEGHMTFPAPLCKRATRDSVLVFIHGWSGDAHETWQQFPRLACDDPRLSHTDVFSVAYPTYMKQSGFTVVEISLWIYRELVEGTALRETEKVAIIAHSMGGLIAREMALKAPTSHIQLHIAGITTISSPHNGADIGTIAAALHVSPHYTSDMKHGSSMLASLHARWNDTDPKYRPRLVCFGGVDDHVVTTDSAFFQCDEQYKIQQWGHSELVKPTSQDDERYRRPMGHIVKALEL